METVFRISLCDYHYLIGLLPDEEALAVLREDVRVFGETAEVHIRGFGILPLMDCMEELLFDYRFGEPESLHVGERLPCLYDSVFRQTARE